MMTSLPNIHQCSLDSQGGDWSDSVEDTAFSRYLLRLTGVRYIDGNAMGLRLVSDFSPDDFVEGGSKKICASKLFSLSVPQLGIWLAQHLDAASPAYNIGEYIEIQGQLDAALFEKALR